MPELPEVETIRRGLAKTIIGRVITDVIIRRRTLREPLPANLKRALTGSTLTGVHRRAKYLLLETAEQTVLAHLGMTGAFLLTDQPPSGKHDHLAFVLDNTVFLIYNDPRRFGRITLTDDIANHCWLRHIGCEPLLASFSGKSLYQSLRGKTMPIKPALLDARIVAGIGNIYASESLFAARLHPATAAGTLTPAQCQRLATAVKTILRKALRAGGSTLRNFTDNTGKPGYFQTQWAVYNRANAPCLICQSPIRQLKQSGRTGYFCPHCQPTANG